MKHVILFLFFTICVGNAYSQSEYKVGVLSQFNTKIKLSQGWKLNTKIEGRHIFSEAEVAEERSNKYRYERTDIALVPVKKIGENNAIGAGYMIRFKDEQIIHRFIQQFLWAHQYENFRLAQRFSTDQTLEEGEATTFRFHYRMGIVREIGHESDEGTGFYLKASNEYLYIRNDKVGDAEIRITPLLGYKNAADFKFEAGLEYRIGGFVSADLISHQGWLYLACYLSL